MIWPYPVVINICWLCCPLLIFQRSSHIRHYTNFLSTRYSIMAIRFTDGLLQNQSPFCASVPPEIHDMILINLFGKRRLRTEWAPQLNGNDREQKARNRPNVLQWTHFVCFKGLSQHFHDDEDDQHWRYYLSSGFILTCKRALVILLVLTATVSNGHTAASFEQGVKILY